MDMPPEFWHAIAQFNQAEFYACHDTLEALWLEAEATDRPFYQGILQIAVGCYHLSNQNSRGAVILLGEGMSRLRPYQPSYGGIALTALLEQTTQLLTQVQQADAAAIAQLSQQMKPQTTDNGEARWPPPAGEGSSGKSPDYRPQIVLEPS